MCIQWALGKRLPSPENLAAPPGSERAEDGLLVRVQHALEAGLVFIDVEGCQKAQSAHGKADKWRQGLILHE